MSQYVDSILKDYAETFGEEEDQKQITGSPESVNIPKEIQESDILPKGVSQFGKLKTSDALQIVETLKNEHVKDARRMLDLQTENAKLKAQIDAYEATNRHADALANSIEELTAKYIQTIQVRTAQTALIKTLKNEIESLKASLPPEPTYGRF